MLNSYAMQVHVISRSTEEKWGTGGGQILVGETEYGLQMENLRKRSTHQRTCHTQAWHQARYVFTLRYYVNGKRIEEALGWSSEGWTLTKARTELIKLKEAQRTGESARTWL